MENLIYWNGKAVGIDCGAYISWFPSGAVSERAGGALGFSLPFASSGTLGGTFSGRERASTGKAVSGFVDGGGDTVVNLQFSDGTYPGANGYVINVSGFYEIV